MTSARRAARRPAPSHRSGLAGVLAAAPARDPHAPLARGCKPRGCRAPARRVLGRRVRYILGSEPGQVNGMRWRADAAPRVESALPLR